MRRHVVNDPATADIPKPAAGANSLGNLIPEPDQIVGNVIDEGVDNRRSRQSARYDPKLDNMVAEALGGSLFGMMHSPLHTKDMGGDTRPVVPLPALERPGVTQEAQRVLPGPEAAQAVAGIRAAEPPGEARIG
jgi:hypothetical protein